MIKAKAGDLVILAITEENIERLKAGDPIYISKEELNIDIDIQLLMGTKAIGIDGRRCLVQSLTQETITELRRGFLKKLPRTPHSSYEVMIFYGKTNEDCIKTINEAIGEDSIPVDLSCGEAIFERMVDGQKVQERGKAPPSIFREEMRR